MEEIIRKYRDFLLSHTKSLSSDVRKIFNETIKELSKEISILKKTNRSITRQLEKNLKQIQIEMVAKLQTLTIKQIQLGQEITVLKNKDLLNEYFRNFDAPALVRKYLLTNSYKIAVRPLSTAIWQYTDPYFNQINLLLEAGFMDGKSAVSVAKELQRLAIDPSRMDLNELRRVGFKKVGGEEAYRKLEKEILNYGPGQGRYNSSFKNSLRLVRTEFNVAYRTQDYNQVQKYDFVKGWLIQTSGQHTIEDECDDLQGEYPKKFKFTGWHPNCTCFATPILYSEKEIAKLIQEKPVNVTPVKTIPSGMRRFVDSKKGQFNRAIKKGTQPYWVDDNFDYIKKYL